MWKSGKWNKLYKEEGHFYKNVCKLFKTDFVTEHNNSRKETKWKNFLWKENILTAQISVEI